MRPRPATATLESWTCFMEAATGLRHVLERELRHEMDMTLPWYETLLMLYRAPGNRLRMNDVADRLVMSKAGVTKLADGMASAGLVDRVVCPSDRRGIHLVLTDRGRKAFKRAAVVHMAGVQEHFGARLSSEELGQVHAAMAKLVAIQR